MMRRVRPTKAGTARLLLSIPIILTGQLITHVGYTVAGANHLNPFRRPS